MPGADACSERVEGGQAGAVDGIEGRLEGCSPARWTSVTTKPCSPLLNDTADHPSALVQAEGRVSVQLHPVSSLGLVASDTSSLQGGADEQPS